MAGKKNGRVFTDQELEEMGTPTRQLICGAIAADEKERAIQLTQRMHEEAVIGHDIYLHWLTGLMSFIGKRYGDEVLEEAIRETYGVQTMAYKKKMQEMDAGGDIRGRVKMLASMHRIHHGPVKIKEDKDKFTFMMTPCTSGGKLIREGCYEEAPCNYYKLKAQPLSYGREDFPVYCAHGAISIMTQIEQTGTVQVFEEPSDKLGVKPCKTYLYKDTSKIPAEMYAKVGKAKPSPKRRSKTSKPASSK